MKKPLVNQVSTCNKAGSTTICGLRSAEAIFECERETPSRHSSLPLSMSTFEPAVVLSILKNLKTQGDRKAFENTWGENVSITGQWPTTTDDYRLAAAH